MASAVKNLRAMFENQNSESSDSPPEHRGRSPALSRGASSASDSPGPRQLSHGRTNFIAVERSAQLGNQVGLRRDSANNSSFAERRMDFAGEAPESAAERKQSLAAEFQARKASVLVEEPIPEMALETPAVEVEKQLGATDSGDRGRNPVPAAKVPSANPDKKTSANEDRHAKPLPGDPTSSAAVSGGAALNGSGGLGEELHGSSNGKVSKSTSSKVNSAAKDTKKTPAPIKTAKPAAAPTKQLAAGSKQAKTPTSSNSMAKSTSTKASVPVGPTKEPTKVPTKKPSTSTSTNNTKPKAPAKSTPSTTSATSRKPSLEVKPKPKSPTRPVKLPSSLTAPTASSGAKTASGTTASSVAPSTRQSLSRSTSSLKRAPSVKSTSGPRRMSATHKERPAVGPPPSRTTADFSKSQAGQADGNFLARMMRPTASSSSKTHEKVASPPKERKQSTAPTRPTTRDGSTPKASFGSPVAKKTAVVKPKTEPVSKATPKESNPVKKAVKKAAAAVGTPKKEPETAAGPATPSVKEAVKTEEKDVAVKEEPADIEPVTKEAAPVEAPETIAESEPIIKQKPVSEPAGVAEAETPELNAKDAEPEMTGATESAIDEEKHMQSEKDESDRLSAVVGESAVTEDGKKSDGTATEITDSTAEVKAADDTNGIEKDLEAVSLDKQD